MDDSTKSSPAKTMKYGADKEKAEVKSGTTPTETAREFATRGVVERHGEAIRNNPNFDKMVDEEMRQIEENRKNTETM
jgi:hypothetical protein